MQIQTAHAEAQKELAILRELTGTEELQSGEEYVDEDDDEGSVIVKE